MNQNQQNKQNKVTIYRRRMGFSQRRVARLLGFRDSSMLSRYEHGQSLPSLGIAFRLSIVLRVPVEFLFPKLYEDLRTRIRAEEEKASNAVQE
jgi:transcriptional regulator with XRE-family HTH domain